jgi:type IV pilus assembly protein PilC
MVLGALFYPAVVVIFALGLFGFVSYFILPQFEQIFKDLQIRLPFLTEAALTIGRYPLQIIAFPFFVLVVGPILFRLLLGSRQGGRVAWARFVYAVPIIGTLIRSMRLAAFTDLLAILIEHELPLPEAFQLAGAASSDPVMAAAAGQVEQDLSLGMPLGEVLRTRLLVPELIAWMTRLGEQRGTLAKNLQQVAGIYRRQVEMRAAFLRTILPPFVIMVTAGVLVTFFVFTIIMPMYKLLEGLSK